MCESIIDPGGSTEWKPRRVVLGVVAVPPTYLPQTVTTGGTQWPYWSKAGLVVRADSPPVLVTVPARWRRQVAIGWGQGAQGQCSASNRAHRRAHSVSRSVHRRLPPEGSGGMRAAHVHRRAPKRHGALRRRQALHLSRCGDGEPERLGVAGRPLVVRHDCLELVAELERGREMDGVEVAERRLELACEIEELVVELDQIDCVRNGSRIPHGDGPVVADRSHHFDASNVRRRARVRLGRIRLQCCALGLRDDEPDDRRRIEIRALSARLHASLEQEAGGPRSPSRAASSRSR